MPSNARACPICKHPAELREKNAAFPFCSARCRLVDLGKWLDGGYVLQTTEHDESGSPEEPDA